MNYLYPMGLPIAMSLTAYNAFLTGLIVMLKRKDRAGVYYFITSFVIFLWGVGISFMLHNDLPDSSAEAWGKFSQSIALFIPCTWLHFVMAYTQQERNNKFVLYLVYALTFLAAPFCLTPAFVAGFREMVNINRYPIPGPIYSCFTALFTFVLFYSFWVFYQAIRSESKHSEKKRDYVFVCFASLYGFVTGSLSFLPVYGIHFPQYNLLIMPLWQILLTYAMIRYRAFDLVEIAEAAQKDKLAAIGTLAASINHEIRNPLYVIQGLSESHLINYKEGIYENTEKIIEKSIDSMERIHQNATRAIGIMKSFALFAKQGRSVSLDNPKASISSILKSILPLVSHEIELEKINLLQDVPPDLPSVCLDAKQGDQIFFNLIVNAFQAMKNAACPNPTIQITASQQNDSVCVILSDNGPGIPANRLKQVFEPFYTTKEEGTGLGLYVTKRLIAQNKGEIKVTSKEGVGTSFKLRFKRY